MDFNYLNFNFNKLKKVNEKNVKPVLSHLILKISFLTQFGCVVKITLDINPMYLDINIQEVMATIDKETNR